MHRGRLGPSFIARMEYNTNLCVCGACTCCDYACTCRASAPQVSSEWRKVSKKLEGEEAYEALDKLERLEVFQVRVLGAGGRLGTSLPMRQFGSRKLPGV